MGGLPDREEGVVGLAFSESDYLPNRCAEIIMIELQKFGEIIEFVEIDQIIQQNGIVEFGFIEIEAFQT